MNQAKTYFAVANLHVFANIKTHGSELRGQEEAVHDERGSYLHVAPLKTLQAL